MTRQQAQIRRAEILRSAASMVARKGFARTRVADVAGDLGISAGLVFYHFESKERLLREAFEELAARDLEEMSAVIEAAGSHAERLRRVIRLHLQAPGVEAGPTTAQSWLRTADAWAEGRCTDVIRDVIRRSDIRRRQRLSAFVGQGVAAGEFACADPDQAALRICVMLDGLVVATQVRGTLSRKLARDWAEQQADRELGLGVDPVSPARR